MSTVTAKEFSPATLAAMQFASGGCAGILSAESIYHLSIWL